MRVLGVVVANLTLAACPGSDGTPIDARPDGGDGQGLTLEFVTASLPIRAGAAAIDEIELECSSIRAIGDAAPGDARTTQLDYRLRWREDDTPEAINFEEAPVGLYSSVGLRLAESGDRVAFVLRGTTTRQGQLVDFEIESTAALDLSVTVDEMLSPGGAATIQLTLEASDLVIGIDWDAQPLDGGKIAIGDGDAAMTQVISALHFALHP